MINIIDMIIAGFLFGLGYGIGGMIIFYVIMWIWDLRHTRSDDK